MNELSLRNFLSSFTFPFVIILLDDTDKKLPIVECSPNPESEAFAIYFLEYIQKSRISNKNTNGSFIYSKYFCEYIQPIPNLYIGVLFTNIRKILFQDNLFIQELQNDLKTPLFNVLMMVSSLKDSVLTLSQKNDVDIIKDSCTYLFGIILNILDYTKLQKGEIKLEPSIFELGQLVDSCINIITPQAKKDELNINYTIAPEIPNYFTGDSRRIKQIIVNLLSNAVKFNVKDGRVEIRVEFNNVNSTLIFFIKDTGKGMTFIQKNKFAEKNQTGIGLLIVKSLCELFKGEMSLVFSEPKQGTIIKVIIPVIVSEEQKQYHNLKESFKDKKVLIIDDNQTSRQIIFTSLMKWNIIPTICTNGTDAMLTLCVHKFDVIFLDESEFDIIKKILKQIKYPCPIIGIIGNTVSKDQIKNKDLFFGFIEKPLIEIKMLEILIECLNIKSSNIYKIVVLESNNVQLAIWKGYLTQMKILEPVCLLEIPNNFVELVKDIQIIIASISFKKILEMNYKLTKKKIIYLDKNKITKYVDFKEELEFHTIK
jgi:CheY-like chemotaxis protein